MHKATHSHLKSEGLLFRFPDSSPKGSLNGHGALEWAIEEKCHPFWCRFDVPTSSSLSSSSPEKVTSCVWVFSRGGGGERLKRAFIIKVDFWNTNFSEFWLKISSCFGLGWEGVKGGGRGYVSRFGFRWVIVVSVCLEKCSLDSEGWAPKLYEYKMNILPLVCGRD